MPVLLLNLLIIFWALCEITQEVKSHQHPSKDRGSKYLLILTSGLGTGLGLLLEHVRATHLASYNTLAYISLPIILLGIILRLWCFRTLGSYFTTTVQTTPTQLVVATGPYKAVRHPSYTALLIIATGLGLLSTNLLTVLFVDVGVLLGLLYRIKVEETALLKDLPEYAAYASTRKRLVPFIW